jgi:membrane-bound serine protease (ClpP class)
VIMAASNEMDASTRLTRLLARLSRVLLVLGAAMILAPLLDIASPSVDAADPSAAPATAGDPTAPVYVISATGIVDSVLAGYIEESIARAEESSSPALVLTINTPGGSLDATQRIVSSLLEAPLPTIVWVTPSGGRAASAGTFITLAGNLAYMAPGTNIGAASPVGAGGEELEGTIGDKVLNDAIANIRSIAEARGRDVEWAVSTVEDAVSSSASEAVAVGAVDGIATSLEDVRRQANGQVVEVLSQPVTIDIATAPFVDLPMNPFQAIIHLLSDPNIAFILFTLGFYGLLFELQNPNFVTGILGAIALILAFIGFGSLPLNVAGILLIGLAVIFFLLEFTVVSHGLLTVAGLVCFVLGAFALYTAPGSPTAPDVSVAIPIIVVMAAATAVFMAFAIYTVVSVRRRSLAFAGAYGAGGTAIVPSGSPAIVRTPLAPLGIVYAAGEEWTAREVKERWLAPGDEVRVVGQDGLTLIVEPAPPGSSATQRIDT